MTVRLIHPVSGGEFDADERAVPQWQRSGWVPAAELQARQASETAPAGAAPVTTSTTGPKRPGPVTTSEE